MADDIVMQILQAIQAKLADLDRRVSDQGRTLNIVKQDVRMVRSTIHDMGKTRVTEGEIVTLHEDVDRMQETITELVGRVEALEAQRPVEPLVRRVTTTSLHGASSANPVRHRAKIIVVAGTSPAT